MAVTSIWNIRGRVDKVIDYAINPGKTENENYKKVASFHSVEGVLEYATDDMKTEKKMFITAINCGEETAARDFMNTKKFYGKLGGNVAYHGYQSFAAGEVDADTAHKIGVELATNLWGDRFQVVVATHCNTGHFHNHFVINSVSDVDGKKYNTCKEAYRLMRRESDRLCDKYGLSVIYDPQDKKNPYAAWKAEQDGVPTKFDAYRRDIDAAIEGSTTMKGFIRAMQELGYEVVTKGKYPRFKEIGREKFHRFYKLGDDYTFEAITNRILDNLREDNPFHRQNNVDWNEAPSDTPENRSNYQILYRNYKLEITFYQKYPYAQKRIHPLIREDLYKLEQIDKQTRFLGKTQIKTMDGLTAYKLKMSSNLDSLIAQRAVLRNKLKKDTRAGNEVEVNKTKAEISALSAQIKEKRKETALCDKIAKRSTQMTSCLSFMSQERDIERKEKNQDEHVRRSGRTTRQDVPEWS
ncbi:MAG: relaxase/mobilization nuclease domain-containing protein [Eubacteriales bacterium]|nr:relaxase/mobilization nuclease domain-containing protein [Eubacteriales bacterium]MDD4474387.1 relaxase/mobilization nuclease domain-containing protein [Eubacteriales bacterium]